MIYYERKENRANVREAVRWQDGYRTTEGHLKSTNKLKASKERKDRMQKVFEDSTTTIIEKDGIIFGIIKDNSRDKVYTVTARRSGRKAETLATRCKYDTAVNLIKEYK